MALTQVQPGMLGTPQPYSFKNRIINGAMVIDQRNAGAAISAATLGTSGFVVDRMQFYGTQSAKFSAQQNQGSVTPPAGFTNYAGLTVASAYTVGASDIFGVYQWIEGYNVADLGFGSASAKTVTVSAWVYSSLTGQFGGTILNSAQNRSYPFSYSVPVANTWTQISVTIPGDTSGTWLKTNGQGMAVLFCLGAGSNFTGTANTWSSNNYWNTTGSTNIVGTNGATFYITGVQLEVGNNATGFDYRPYGTEFSLCERYCEVVSQESANTRVFISANVAGSQCYPTYFFRTKKRAAPSLSVTGSFIFESFGSAQTGVSSINTNSFNTIQAIATVNLASSPSNGGHVFTNSSDAKVIFSAEL